MAIVLADEQVFPLADVPKYVPARRGGKKLHIATAFRWVKGGVRGVRLEVIRVGGSLCTSREALQRFFDRLTESTDGQPAGQEADGSEGAAQHRCTPAARRKALERAQREAEDLGI